MELPDPYIARICAELGGVVLAAYLLHLTNHDVTDLRADWRPCRWLDFGSGYDGKPGTGKPQSV